MIMQKLFLIKNSSMTCETCSPKKLRFSNRIQDIVVVAEKLGESTAIIHYLCNVCYVILTKWVDSKNLKKYKIKKCKKCFYPKVELSVYSKESKFVCYYCTYAKWNTK